MFKRLHKSLILFLIKRKIAESESPGRKVSLLQAKKVGLLAEIDSKEIFEQVVQFKKAIESYGPKISALAFVPFKKVPDYFSTQMQFEVFSKKNINLAGIPGGPRVKDFLQYEFDVLINVSGQDNWVMNYIAGFSAAEMKAGRYCHDMTNVYDFMIKGKENENFEEFLFSMRNYLSKINISAA